MTDYSRDVNVTESSSATAPAVPGAPATSTYATTTSQRTTLHLSGAEMSRRVITLVFGIVELFIGLRILLLLLDAREANGLVTFILNISQIFVAPFEGVLRTDALHSAGSTLDVAAIVAVAGWAVLVMVLFWAINLFSRREATRS
jgi:hypothetical protein